MLCASKFLDAVGVELQRLPSLRMIWCQRTGRVWVSAGMRRRFGLKVSHFDELAGWGLTHPEDHSRIVEAFEILHVDEGVSPIVLRGVRLLLAPGVWAEFDAAYSRLGCGGIFGALPEGCAACGLVMVAMRECVPGRWVDPVDLLEADDDGAVQPETCEASEVVGTSEAVELAAVAPGEAVEALEAAPCCGAAVPEDEAAAVARAALAAQWDECRELLERVRFERLKLGVDHFAPLARRDGGGGRYVPGSAHGCIVDFLRFCGLSVVSVMVLAVVVEGPPRQEKLVFLGVCFSFYLTFRVVRRALGGPRWRVRRE